jgi:hypothetical protein
MSFRFRHGLWLAAPLVGAVALAGCEGGLGGPDDTEPDPDKDPAGLCPEGVAIGASPLRRLSRTEYLRTVRDLVAPVPVPELALLPDKAVEGFENNEKTQTATPDLVADQYAAAQKVAGAVSANAAAFAGCSYGTPSEAQACAEQVADTLGRRAYRRPLTEMETATFRTFLATNAAEHGFETALGMFVQGVLLSPGFLYRPEWGVADPSVSEALPLSGYELASRLSYFLWQSMPDEALFAAADSGALETPEGLEAEAKRLLADPRAREAVGDFHRQWMDLDKMKEMSRDTALFPAWNDGTVPPALAQATARYLDHVFWESEGTVSELLVSPKAYVNDTLAPLYGIDPPGSSDLVLVDLDPSKRAGFLTQAGPMAAMAHEKFDAPILRGVFVLRRMLCADLGPPPPDVADIPPAEEGEGPKTTRQRIEESHTGGACAGCHDLINPLGFAFSHYDAAGQFRTQENGLPIDATGASEELGGYDGAVELSSLLAESEDVRACVVKQWFRFAMGRLDGAADRCEISRLEASFTEGGGTMRDLLLDIVMSDSFRYRSPLGDTP